MSRGIVVIAGLAILLGTAGRADAQEPGWTGRVLKVGAERAAVNAVPIEQRPYRPLHFYGNAIRRQYHRGTALPAPRDVVEGTRAFFRNR